LKKLKQPKYKDNTCPMCKADLIPVAINVPDTKMRCVKCGAVYINLNDHSLGTAGEFTGRYLPVDKSRRYEGNFAGGQKPVV